MWIRYPSPPVAVTNKRQWHHGPCVEWSDISVTFIFRKSLLTSKVYTVFKIITIFFINDGPNVKHWWRSTCMGQEEVHSLHNGDSLIHIWCMSSLSSEASIGTREQPLERSIGGSVVAVLECPYRYTPLKKLFPHSLTVHSRYKEHWYNKISF